MTKKDCGLRPAALFICAIKKPWLALPIFNLKSSIVFPLFSAGFKGIICQDASGNCGMCEYIVYFYNERLIRYGGISLDMSLL